MAVTPPNNLPPDSQPWARDRDAAISQLQFDVTKNAETNYNAFVAVNNSLSAIGLQLELLTEQQAQINAAVADIAAQQASLTSQQGQINAALSDLSARVTTTSTVATFNTGSLPNDFVDRPYGSSMPITIAVPTGKLVVTVGCAEASIAVGGSGSAVIAYATFSISGGVASMLGNTARAYLSGGSQLTGSSLCLQQAFTVTPGTYTVTGQMYATAAGATGQSVNFRQPYLTVQVTG